MANIDFDSAEGGELFRRNLKRILDETRVKPAELARRLGVNRSAVHKWLNGQSQPNLDTLLEVARALRVPVNDLFDDIDRPEHPLLTKEEINIILGITGRALERGKKPKSKK
jgi:transcriptional regulator with XRE-family HTH domain